MEITIDMIRCVECHDNKWEGTICSNCGNDIENSYIGNRDMYEALLEVVKNEEI